MYAAILNMRTMNLKHILHENNFRFSKAYGQNFITDENLLRAIVQDAGVFESDEVLEIGTGGGTLTLQIARQVRHVVTYEIDTALQPVLAQMFQGYSNITSKFQDVMKVPLSEIEQNFEGNYHVIANLPYYITTPIMMKLIEESKRMQSMTVMVQKEVAERICAAAGSKEYGAISAVIALYGGAKITRIVNRQLFYPVPNVDSAVLHIRFSNGYSGDRAAVSRVIHQSFGMRRKTLVNNLISAYGWERSKAEQLLQALNWNTMVRAEQLTVADFIQLTQKIKEFEG